MDSTQVPMPVELRKFLEELLLEAKIDNPDPALKEMMLEDLYQRLQVRFMQVLAEHLEAEDLEAYTELAAEDQAKAMEFLRSKNNKLPEYFLQAMQEFRQTFLN
jgi:hypothetical protein